MGDGRSSHVIERVADVLARLGGDPRGARPGSDSGRDGTADDPSVDSIDRSDDADAVRAVTDGGADGAPPGESPWADDDPIVFGDESDSDHSTALLDAVTDTDATSAPPFESESATADADDRDDGSDSPETGGVDPNRIDELEARIEALEADHVQLESSLTDVARGVASLQDEVDTVGTDVGRLVTMLGGVAIASAGAEASEVDGGADTLEAADAAEDRGARDAAEDTEADDTADEAEADDTADEAEAHDATDDREADSTAEVHGADGTAEDLCTRNAAEKSQTHSAADDHEGSTAIDGDGANDPDDEPESPGIEDVDRSAAPRSKERPAGEEPPDGIHRGAGDPPQPHETADSDAFAVGSTSVNDATTSSVNGTPSDADEPARELVDPRTEAVGARLRQFRGGFIDDPTADLPTGNTADEFRFDKVLLPTDGDEAPDLSNAELEKPYLESLPDGYAVDAVVLEWLDWLVSAADRDVAAQAVAYYESIEWLTADVREALLGYLDGLGEAGANAGGARSVGDAGESAGSEEPFGEPPAALDLQDHLRSLQYVTELASGEVGTDGV